MTTVTLRYHHEDGSWWAESDDLPGFSALGDTLDQVRVLARDGVRFYLQTDAVEIRELPNEPAGHERHADLTAEPLITRRRGPRRG